MLDKVCVREAEVSIDELDGKLDAIIALLTSIRDEVPEEYRADAYIDFEMWEDDGELQGQATVYHYRPKTAEEMEAQRLLLEASARAREEFMNRHKKAKVEEVLLDPKMTIPLI